MWETGVFLMHQGKITEVFSGGIKNFPLFSHLRYIQLNDAYSKFKNKPK